mgnify:CR=1 FL=1
MKLSNSILLFFVMLSANMAIGLSADYEPVFNKVKSDWSESVFQSLRLEERIGQRFMVAAYSNKDTAHERDLATVIKNVNIGGLLFFSI